MILPAAVRPLHPAPLPPHLRRSSSPAATVAASTKRPRRWRRPSPLEDDARAEVGGETHDIGSAELAFLTALESQAPPLDQDREAPSAPPSQPAPLRGLDVLQALQHKASASASRKGAAGAGGGRGGRGQRRGARGGGGGGEAQLDGRDYSNVRPLDIKSDWGARLDELDRLVQELQAQQHLYSD